MCLSRGLWNGIPCNLSYMKAFGEKESPVKKKHAPRWFSNCWQKIAELFQNVECIIKSRGELFKKFVGAKGVYLVKTYPQESQY